jgi:hypothetical protein
VVLNDAKITKCRGCDFNNEYYGMFASDKIILSDKYYINDAKTIQKL